jgi:hypothetical protein
MAIQATRLLSRPVSRSQLSVSIEVLNLCNPFSVNKARDEWLVYDAKNFAKPVPDSLTGAGRSARRILARLIQLKPRTPVSRRLKNLDLIGKSEENLSS